MFDFSNYPKDSKFFDPTNEKVIGKMKDLSEGKIIDEFVGLKSKMHSMRNINGKESKGVNIATEFNEFKATLFLKSTEVKNINLEHMKSTKYHYVLIIKDLF